MTGIYPLEQSSIQTIPPISFVHSFILHLLSTYHVSGTVLGTVDLLKNKGDQNPCSRGVQTLALDLVGAQILAENKHSVSELYVGWYKSYGRKLRGRGMGSAGGKEKG